MIKEFSFSLPFPPTSNHYHMPVRMGKGARCIKSPKITKYQREAVSIIQGLGLADLNISEKVEISLVMHPPTLRRYDCSNFLKAYEDALVQANFLEDDHLIEYGAIKKGEKKKGGELIILVKIIEGE